jgi:hypothetical protein
MVKSLSSLAAGSIEKAAALGQEHAVASNRVIARDRVIGRLILQGFKK